MLGLNPAYEFQVRGRLGLATNYVASYGLATKKQASRKAMSYNIGPGKEASNTKHRQCALTSQYQTVVFSVTRRSRSDESH